MTKPLRAGLVGYGNSARIFHAPLLAAAEEFQLHSVVQRHSDSASEDYADVKVVRDLKSLLKNDEIDLVVITTPNHLHFEQASEALRAGKHVVVEKPFTPTWKEATSLIELAEKKNRVITVYQNRRWDGDFLTVKKVLENQLVGRPVEFISVFNRFRNYLRDDAWKEKDLPGSGILYDLGSHLMDQALQLFGPPDSIYADIRSQRKGEADDYFEIDLHYDAFKVKLQAGMLVLDDTPRFILRGTEGAYVKHGLDPQEEALKTGGNPGTSGWGEENQEHWGILRKMDSGNIKEEKIETLPGSYISFYHNLADAIHNNKTLAVKAEEGALVIKLLESAKMSSRKGKALKV